MRHDGQRIYPGHQVWHLSCCYPTLGICHGIMSRRNELQEGGDREPSFVAVLWQFGFENSSWSSSKPVRIQDLSSCTTNANHSGAVRYG